MTRDRSFVVCIDALEGEDLLVGRLYRAQADTAGARSGLIRVWDESGEDYLYSAAAFIHVNVEQSDRERLEGALAAL